MPIDLDGMGIFAEVVEAGGISAAARELGLSKSAVSKRVARLEEALGVRLLNRTTRQIAVTEAGEAFYESCAKVVAEAQRAEERLGLMRDEPHGLLRVNAPVALGRSFVLPAVLELQRRHPQLEVELNLQDDYVDLIATGTDVAVRVGRLADSSLIARKLAPVRAVIVASPDFLARHGTPTTPEDLAELPLMRYTLMASPNRMTLLRGDDKRIVELHGPLSSNNGAALIDAALAGVGVTSAPWFLVADELASGRLVPILSEWTMRAAAVYAVFPHGHHVALKLRRFLDVLVEHAADNPLFGPPEGEG